METPENTSQLASSPLAAMLNPNMDAARQRRAQTLITNIILEQKAMLTDLERQENALAAKLEGLVDELSPDDTTSLKFGKGVDPKKWVSDVQDVKEQLQEVKFKLEIARTTLAEFTATPK